MEFWGLTQAQFLVLLDRYELERYERNCYLSSINRILFAANFGSQGAPPLIPLPRLSTELAEEEKGPDPELLIKAFEKIFPVRDKK